MDPTLQEADRLEWLTRVRPGALGALLAQILRRQPPRTIFPTAWGVRLYLDPLSRLGSSFRKTGDYEPETRKSFQTFLREGDVVVDVGANEGVFSCLAAKLVGPSGKVIAVEPQARVHDLIEINALLNGFHNILVERSAISTETLVTLSLFPALNTGASSIVSRYRWSALRQRAPGLSFPRLMEKYGLEKIDFVKVDVEGYEAEVVDSILPCVSNGSVRTIILDYHKDILAKRGISAQDIEAQLLSAGMRRVDGSGTDGYAAYSAQG